MKKRTSTLFIVVVYYLVVASVIGYFVYALFFNKTESSKSPPLSSEQKQIMNKITKLELEEMLIKPNLEFKRDMIDLYKDDQLFMSENRSCKKWSRNSCVDVNSSDNYGGNF